LNYSFPGAGVNRFGAVAHTGEATGAFEGIGVDRLDQDLEPDLLVLLNGLREAWFVYREPFFPSFFPEFFFATHFKKPFKVKG